MDCNIRIQLPQVSNTHLKISINKENASVSVGDKKNTQSLFTLDLDVLFFLVERRVAISVLGGTLGHSLWW